VKTVFFEDKGQGFLEWDIEDDVVVGCRPFQDQVWIGTKVHNTDIKPGDKLDITVPDGIRTALRHAVEKVEEKKEAPARKYIITVLGGGQGYTLEEKDLSGLECVLQFGLELSDRPENKEWLEGMLEKVRKLRGGCTWSDMDKK